MNVINFILTLLYPKKCPFCRRLIDEKRRVCPSCSTKLPYIYQRPPRKYEHLDECYSCLEYKDTVRESIHRYKFSGAAVYAEIYGDFLTKCIDENGISCDIITWVPLSGARLRKRGYDQARLLAEAVAGRRGLECLPLLRKIRDNKAQSGISDEAKRKKNVSGVYKAITEFPITGKHILIIDDVVTTGSTLSECAGALKKAGAHRVTALTVASAGK